MATTSGTLTATGSITLTKPRTDTLTTCVFSGTYGTVELVFEGSDDSSNYFPVAAIAYATGVPVSGTIALVDDSEVAYKIPSEGLTQVRARVTAIASGTLAVSLKSATYNSVAYTSVNQSVSSIAATSFTGDLTMSGGKDIIFSGSTGESEIHLTDNLADALSVKIAGGADFMVFDSTNSAEVLTLPNTTTISGTTTLSGTTTISGATTHTGNVTMSGAVDLIFSGTTGQPEIKLTDNLADALSIGESTNDYVVITTTNNAEVVGLKTRLSLGAGTELTIATGAITVTQGYHTVDTESDAASDDLDTINGGVAGQICVFRAANGARTPTFKDGTGNLKLGGDRALDNAEDTITLISDGTDWYEVAFANNGT